MRGFKDGYGFVGLIVIFLCGLLTLDLGAPIEAAAYKIKIAAPLSDSVVSGTVAISLLMKTGTSFANVYVDGVYLASTPNAISWLDDRCGQWHAHYFRESLRLSQPGNRNFLEIGSRKKQSNSDADRYPLADRSTDYQLAGERCDRLRHRVDSGAIRRAGQLAQFLRRRKLGRIVSALHIGLDFKQRRERPHSISVNGYNTSNALVATTSISLNVKNGSSPLQPISNSDGSAHSSAHLDPRANSHARGRSEYYVAEVGRDCFRHGVCRRAERRACQLGQFLH